MTVAMVRHESGDESHKLKNIAVTVDGTWMHRGFSSMYGIVFAIAWEIGKVVDFCVLSQYCQACKLRMAKRRSGGISEQKFSKWKMHHQPSCDVTSHVSAPAMESEGVEILLHVLETERRSRK